MLSLIALSFLITHASARGGGRGRGGRGGGGRSSGSSSSRNSGGWSSSSSRSGSYSSYAGGSSTRSSSSSSSSRNTNNSNNKRNRSDEESGSGGRSSKSYYHTNNYYHHNSGTRGGNSHNYNNCDDDHYYYRNYNSRNNCNNNKQNSYWNANGTYYLLGGLSFVGFAGGVGYCQRLRRRHNVIAASVLEIKSDGDDEARDQSTVEEASEEEGSYIFMELPSIQKLAKDRHHDKSNSNKKDRVSWMSRLQTRLWSDDKRTSLVATDVDHLPPKPDQSGYPGAAVIV